ncbi:hypothetical protein QYF36_009455 [Acer negundo]|nr:hypothetical protein QYF36_009455 [Acer negundo]
MALEVDSASKLADSQRSTTEDGHTHRPTKPQTVVPPSLDPLNISQLRMGTLTGPPSHKLWCLLHWTHSNPNLSLGGDAGSLPHYMGLPRLTCESLTRPSQQHVLPS